MSIDISNQLQTNINSWDFFSIYPDETTDIKSFASLAIFAQYSKGSEMCEEILKSANITKKTKSIDFCDVVVNELKKNSTSIYNKLFRRMEHPI